MSTTGEEDTFGEQRLKESVEGGGGSDGGGGGGRWRIQFGNIGSTEFCGVKHTPLPHRTPFCRSISPHHCCSVIRVQPFRYGLQLGIHLWLLIAFQGLALFFLNNLQCP